MMFKGKNGRKSDVFLCNKMRIVIVPNKAGANTCNVHKVATKVQLVSGCKADFTVLCLKSSISFDLLYLLSHNGVVKRIKE